MVTESLLLAVERAGKSSYGSAMNLKHSKEYEESEGEVRKILDVSIETTLQDYDLLSGWIKRTREAMKRGQ